MGLEGVSSCQAPSSAASRPFGRGEKEGGGKLSEVRQGRGVAAGRVSERREDEGREGLEGLFEWLARVSWRDRSALFSSRRDFPISATSSRSAGPPRTR